MHPLAFLRQNALTVVILLMAASVALTAYAVRTAASERSATILRECQQQNARHDATVAELDRLLNAALAHAPGPQRREIAASRAFTVLLIDRLAPKQNCQQVTARDTHP